MTNRNEASSAIAALNGRNLHGRDLSVNEARPREERSGPRPGGGGGRGGFKSGGGGGGGRSKGQRW
jgi:RNA recognition motif-containing protein